MYKNVSSLFSSSLVKNIGILTSGTVFAQIIAILASPLITRIFLPSDFGELGLFLSFVTIFASFATLAYARAIVLPKLSSIANSLIIISFGIVFIVSIASLIVFFLLGKEITLLFDLKSLEDYLKFIPLFVLLLGTVNILEQTNIRYKSFKVLSKIMIFQSILVNSIKIVVGYFSPSVGVLIFSTLTGHIYNSIIIMKNIYRKISFGNITKRKIIYTLIKYKDFPKFRASQQFLSTISHTSPIMLLTYYFSPIIAGYFILAERIVKLPISILSQSVSKVYLQHLSNLHNEKRNLYQPLKKATLALGLIGTVPTLVIVLWGPALFSFIFGDNWNESGIYAQFLIISLFVSFMTTPSIQFLTVSLQQKYLLKWEVITTILKVFSIAIMGILNINIYTVMLAYSLISAVTYSLLILKAFNLVQNKERVNV